MFELLKIYSIYEIFLVKSFIDLQHMDDPILMKDRDRQGMGVHVSEAPSTATAVPPPTDSIHDQIPA